MFDEFVVGFNQAAERFAIIDAGELKEGSDHKIRGVPLVPYLTPNVHRRRLHESRPKAYLDDNIYSTQTLKVFFGGEHFPVLFILWSPNREAVRRFVFTF